MAYSNQEDYIKSNSIQEILPSAHFSKKYWNSLLKAGEGGESRRNQGQRLLDHISHELGISSPKLIIKNIPQAHSDDIMGRTKKKTEGVYSKEEESITLFNLTAKQRRPVAILSLAKTLVHEYGHHYDIKILGLNSSPHTLGFYKRISDLKEKLENGGE